MTEIAGRQRDELIASTERLLAFPPGVAATANGDPWAALFRAAAEERPPEASELVPYWLHPLEGGAHVERPVPALDLGRDLTRLANLRKTLAAYRMVFGPARRDDLVDFLLKNIPEVCVVGLCGSWRGLRWLSRDTGTSFDKFSVDKFFFSGSKKAFCSDLSEWRNHPIKGGRSVGTSYAHRAGRRRMILMKHLVRRISGFAATFALAGLAAGCGMGMEEPEELGEISQESVSKLARGYYTGPDAEIKLEDNDELASTVFTITRRFEPGTVTSWHIHPGMAVGTVVEGSLLLETETHCQTYVAGETFVQGPDVALRNSNPSDTEEALLLVNLFQKDGDPPSLPASVENPACSE